MAVHTCLKNEFTEDEKYQNLMRWLICSYVYSFNSTSFQCHFTSVYAYFCTNFCVLVYLYVKKSHFSVCLTGDEKISKDHIYEPPHDKTNKMTVRPVKTQISLDIRPVWSESSLCAQWVAKDPSFLHVDSGDWSNYADAQADLSLCWAHILFCWVCHVVARMLLSGAICVSCTCFCSRSNIHTCVYDSLINFSVLLFPINIRETLSSGLRPVKTKTRLHSHRS